MELKSEFRSRLVGELMKDGKKAVIQKQVDNAVDYVLNKLSIGEKELYDAIIKELYCPFILIPKRIGRYIYKVPVILEKTKAIRRALKHFCKSIKFKASKTSSRFTSKRTKMSIFQKLIQELINTFKGDSISISRIKDIKKLAETNKAFVR